MLLVSKNNSVNNNELIKDIVIGLRLSNIRIFFFDLITFLPCWYRIYNDDSL